MLAAHKPPSCCSAGELVANGDGSYDAQESTALQRGIEGAHSSQTKRQIHNQIKNTYQTENSVYRAPLLRQAPMRMQKLCYKLQLLLQLTKIGLNEHRRTSF